MALRSGWNLQKFLPAIYAIFALSATSRALYTLIRKYDEAPFAYWLSLVAALTYVAVTILLFSNRQGAKVVAKSLITFELVGVITVGMLSLMLPALFQHPTVWSLFGIGYAFIPLVLPILGLYALRSAK
jgi:hypothetical protein